MCNRKNCLLLLVEAVSSKLKPAESVKLDAPMFMSFAVQSRVATEKYNTESDDWDVLILMLRSSVRYRYSR